MHAAFLGMRPTIKQPASLSGDTLQHRFHNMVASFRMENIELDAATIAQLNRVLSGEISAERLKQTILAEYQSLQKKA